MSTQLTTTYLMTKAETLCSSARTLLNLGDTDSAINRAYYAMFHAARVALLKTDAPVDPNIVRTHKGLIGAFGQYVVKNNPELSAMGRILSRAQTARIIADYADSSDKPAVAEEIVNQAENFVATIKALQFDKQPAHPKREPTSGSSSDPF